VAYLGNWGPVTFVVSRNELRTFDGFNWGSAANFASHPRHLKAPVAEFSGLAADTISFNMLFARELGADPLAEITKLMYAERAGEAHRLVVGAKAYGTGLWAVTGSNKALERFDAGGRILMAKVGVSLMAYPIR
jgi:hypothetical protein